MVKLARDPQTGLCSVCSIRKRLTDTGVVKVHARHDVRCAGSLAAPRPLADPQRRPDSWASRRRETIARDDGRCRKCRADNDLEAHHKRERVYGGSDEIDNLVTLCGLCHDEWTVCEPPATVMTFDTWLTIPPMRHLLVVFASKWPEDTSAAAFKEQIVAALELFRVERETSR